MYGLRLYWDPSIILLLIGFGITMLASASMRSTFSKYQQITASRGMTGAQAAARILTAADIQDVAIQPIEGSLTDHYDPRNKTVSLSESVFGQRSIAAVCVAAHECGHAIQHKENYAPLIFRTAIVPVASFGSSMAWPIFLVGLVMAWRPLQIAGIVLFSAAVIFQLATLPVEFNASSRALAMLEYTGILSPEENKGAKKVLNAAALTYVASLAASVLQLLRLVLLASGGRRRD